MVGRRLALTVLVAATGSAVPSTLHALASGRDVLEATRAAGTLLLPEDAPQARLLAAGVAAHATLSLGWGAALVPALARARRPLVRGALLGAVVAAVDLTIARRRHPRIAALPTAPQVADHVAFGLLVAAAWRRRVQSAPTGGGAGQEAATDPGDVLAPHSTTATRSSSAGT